MKKLLFFFAMLIITGSYAADVPKTKSTGKAFSPSPVYGSYTDVGSVAFNPDLVEFYADYDDSTHEYTLSVKVLGGVRFLQITGGVGANASGNTPYGYWYGGSNFIDGGTVLLPVNSVYTSDSTSEGPVVFCGPGTVTFTVNIVDYYDNDMSVTYTSTIP